MPNSGRCCRCRPIRLTRSSDWAPERDALMDPTSEVGKIFAQVLRQSNDAAIPMIERWRMSGNVEVAPPTPPPSLAELTGEGSKYGTPYVSNWDLVHKRHLMDPTPLADQELDVRTTTAPEVLSQQIWPEGAPGFVQNPGTYIPSQHRNRQLIGNVDPRDQ